MRSRSSRPLVIRLTRLSPTHHRFAIVRPDGGSEEVTLETRSCLVHDLVHFALESEAGLAQSFYGRLASGARYAEFTDAGASAVDGAELLATERVVGALQGALTRPFAPAAFLGALSGYLTSIGESVPPWLTADLLVRVQERMRQLQGRWRATPFGTAMELQFETHTCRAAAEAASGRARPQDR